MRTEFNKYLRRYSYFVLWLGFGAVAKPLGAIVVVLTFLFLIKKEKKVQILVSLWVLFVLSDNNQFGFATMVKPIVMLITGMAVLFNVIKVEAKNKFIISFLPFFAFCALASLFSIVWISSYQKLLSYFFLFLITSQLISQIFKEKKVIELIKDMLYIGTALSTVCVLTGILIPSFGSKYDGRLNGLFQNPNGLGLFASTFFMLSSLFFGMTKHFGRLFRRYTMLIVVVCLVMSGSRTSMGAALIFYLGSITSSLSPWFFVVIASMLGYFFTDLYELVLGLIVKTGFGQQLRISNIEEASGRIFIWRAALMEIQNFYLMGGGFDFTEGAYAIWKVKYNAIIPDLKYHLGNIHQSFLTMWLNNGLIGLILFCYGWIRKIFESLNKSRLTLPLAFALIFMGSYESWLVASMNPYTIQVVIMFTVILNYKGKLFEEKPEKPILVEQKDFRKFERDL